MSQRPLRLYSYWRSSSAWRARIGIYYKGLDCEIVPVHLTRPSGGEQHEPEFAERNPMEQVPVLEVLLPRPRAGNGGTVGEIDTDVLRITQSMAILEYLDERWPEPALVPRDRDLRARVRELAEIVNSGIQPFQNLRLQSELRARNVDPLPITRHFIEAGLNALELHALTTAGTYLVGDSVTLADLYLVPQLFGARRHGVDVELFPTLRRVEQACEALSAFQAAHPNAQPDREIDSPRAARTVTDSPPTVTGSPTARGDADPSPTARAAIGTDAAPASRGQP